MRRPLRRLFADRDGTAALEFALVGSVFLLLIFVVIEAGLLLWTKNAMQMAASQTARCTAVGSSACTNPQAYATSLIDTWNVAGLLPAISVSAQSGTTCNSTSGHFSIITITSGQIGLGSFVSLLAGTVLTASACYPSGT